MKQGTEKDIGFHYNNARRYVNSKIRKARRFLNSNIPISFMFARIEIISARKQLSNFIEDTIISGLEPKYSNKISSLKNRVLPLEEQVESQYTRMWGAIA